MAAPTARAASGAVQADWLDNQSLTGPSHQLHLDEPLLLDCGRALPEYVVNFETYGTLSTARDNAILVCHSLTSRAHAAGRHAPDDQRPGWWDAAIGPGKMLDTRRYFVICADALGAGQTTGPASPDPETGRRYGVRFPVITVRDMVRAQHRLVQRLGIDRLHAVIGGCMGGQQAVEWAIAYPAMVGNAVVITTTPATSAHTIAIFSVMRHLIRADPEWNAGDYYGRSFPAAGLGAAVAAAVPLWMSREAMEARFGRRSSGYRYTLGPEFEVESFIARLVAQARHDTDPNGLMYLMRAVEYFDLEREYGDLEAAFRPVSARVMFVSYRRDWRYPAAEAERMREAMTAAGGDARHLVLDSAMGHGAFLYDMGDLAARVSGFLGAPMRMTAPMTGTMTATARVWDALCRHIDGMAIGTTMAALHERGALAMLAAQDRTEFGPLRERLAANARVPARGAAPAGRPGLGRPAGGAGHGPDDDHADGPRPGRHDRTRRGLSGRGPLPAGPGARRTQARSAP